MRMSMSTVITIMTIMSITILDHTMVVWRRAKPVERMAGGNNFIWTVKVVTHGRAGGLVSAGKHVRYGLGKIWIEVRVRLT